MIFLNGEVAFAIAAILAGLACFNTNMFTLNAALDGLDNETRLLSLEVKGSFDEMINDGFVVSRTPPIDAVIRTQKAGDGIDPQDGSSLEQWRQRLETIFISVMTARPHYSQMRYVGVKENGRELVRVNRTPDGLVRVASEDLQEKAGESYMQRLITSKPSQPYFSPVSYNRERGEVEAEKVPTIRTIVPVYTESKELFGAIIINTNYAEMLSRTLEQIRPTKQTFIVNHFGDYLEYDPTDGVQSLEFHEDYSRPAPAFVQRVLEQDESDFQIVDKTVTSFHRLNLSRNDQDAYVGVLLQVDKGLLLEGANKATWITILIATGLIVLSIAISVFLATILVRPLGQMTREIRNLAITENAELHLPVNQNDEIGELARAFDETLTSLRQSQQHSAQLIQQLERSNRDLDEFAYAASHDLKSPLRAIDQLTRWIEEDGNIEGECREHLHLLRRRVNRMDRLLEDLLEYSRIGRDRNRKYDSRIRADILIREIADFLTQESELVVEIQPALAKVEIPRMPLEQVFLNLINNSIKHHDKKQGHISVDVKDCGEYLLFEVQDDGPGIADKYHERVFRMFQTLQSRDQVEGSGMGLAIVAKHVESVGAKIELQSSEGEGCLFKIRWPKDDPLVSELDPASEPHGAVEESSIK